MERFDYSRIVDSANRLIDRFGRGLSIRRAGGETGPAYDPVFEPPSDHPCRGVVLSYDSKEIDGTLIRTNDRKVYISVAGLDIVPTASDLLNSGGEVMSILSVKPLAPGDVTVLYEIQARS